MDAKQSYKLHEDGVSELAYSFSLKDEKFKALTGSTGIETFSEDSHFIGVNPNALRDDETFGDFKKRIASLLTEAGVPAKAEEIKFYSDAGQRS